MGLIKGGALRLFQTLLYVLCFCCAGAITGIFGYFLAVLADRDITILTRWKAVIGMAGVATVYTIFAILLTCCLAGLTFFSFLGLFIDILCCGAMIAIAVLLRSGARSCSGNVNTPLGSGPSDSTSTGYGANGFGFGSNENSTYAPNLGLACRLNKAAFIIAIIGAVLFLLTALMQVFLVRHHKKEDRFGPSPDNNYTSGYGKRKFWQRKPKTTTEKEAEMGAAGTGAALAIPHPNVRPSHDTAYTGSTVAAPAGNRFSKKEVDHDVPVVPYNNNNHHGAHDHTTPNHVEPNLVSPHHVANNNGQIYSNMTSEPNGEHAPHVGWTPHSHGQDSTARNF